ncbi:MAG: site-specific integrase [Desulfovibrio sp.]|nr:site-specific integrase [Desulfovibrio sp.]
MLRKVLRDSGAPNANYARKDLSAAWEWGKRFYGLPRINPFHEVEKFPVDEKPRYVPPESDFWKVYDMADDNDKVLLLFLLHTGARCGEAFRLRWEDIDLQEQKVRLGTRKRAGGGMEYDWIPLTSELQAALAEHKSRTKSLYVFNSQVTGQHFVRRGTFMKALCATAGVKHFGYHAIRHLSATILAYAGLDIPTVQAVLRHKNPNTTAHYIKSLGIQPDKLDSVFSKRRASKVVPFKARAVGT